MEDSAVSTDPVPLATAADFVKRFPTLAKSFDEEIIAETMVEATDTIEAMVNRRLAPFTSLVYEDRLIGIDPNEYGADSDTPLPFAGSLGLSFANALGGADDLVRHFWLDQFAPIHPELWTYNIQSCTITLTYGNTQIIDVAGGGIINGAPNITDGHMWLRLGTFAPEGTMVRVVYDGGYTKGIPPNLKRACLYQAQEFLIRDAEPQNRPSMNTDGLESLLTKLLAPWARG